MKTLSTTTLLTILFLSCSFSIFKTSEISSKSLPKYLRENSNEEIIFVDLRNKEDFESSHIKGAIHIDYFSPCYPKELFKIPKDKTIILYCKHGLRSKNAVSLLKSYGYKRAYSLKGGFKEWEKLGFPIERGKN